ncbi:YbaN family protein [Alkaliphilus hydrothermalis]|uniref:Uncharacterized membrane protein YbaN (DUF454 family) n=1 Tax=Alkaliphilus hydrothermalis TaxID=1482730 RepID=A0ABS2NMG1_9FIRM|nr:YbaN family protein [Alkaliphilus hydrothermalis]MBM7613764.1 uncharacterized membrane protein YbaN (DUF454 family) [Alkaliphilus hydrothermalis]
MKRILLIIIGVISLILGVIGILLPIVPTTPFLLLSLSCFMKSSKSFYDYVLSNRYLSPYVNDYLSSKKIPLKVKKRAIFLLWVSIGCTALFVIDKTFLKLMLFAIACTVSIYIWTRP